MIDLLRRRLNNQKLARSTFKKPADVVRWLGAVQSQDYAGARWGLAQRAVGLTDAAIARAFDDGEILRTHFMRPTWHFVTPEDIRWMVALTAPRVHTVSGSYYRKLGLDAAIFRRSHSALERALEGGRHLTRPELAQALQRARVPCDGLRMNHLVMQAELERVICSGARRGKQFTYALFEERVPPAKPMDRDEAIVELARRYFTSHGPATVRDFVWWSGLTVRDAKIGVEAAGLERERIGDLTYWSSGTAGARSRPDGVAYLLPNYDEYLIAYKDRAHIASSGTMTALVAPGNTSFAHHLIVDGVLAGAWKRTIMARETVVEVRPYRRLQAASARAIRAAAARYEKFLGMSVRLELV